jgi:hypothetical protein
MEEMFRQTPKLDTIWKGAIQRIVIITLNGNLDKAIQQFVVVHFYRIVSKRRLR